MPEWVCLRHKNGGFIKISHIVILGIQPTQLQSNHSTGVMLQPSDDVMFGLSIITSDL